MSTVSSQKHLSPGAVAAIISAARAASPRDGAMLALIATYALRESECAALSMGDISLVGGAAKTLYIRGLKGGSEGVYALIEPAASALNDWLAVRGTAPGALFPAPRQAERGSLAVAISRHTVHRAWQLYRSAGGPLAETLGVHCLRHSCGMALAEAGVDVRDIQAWMRHASLDSSMVYIARASHHRAAAAQKISGVFAAQKEE